MRPCPPIIFALLGITMTLNADTLSVDDDRSENPDATFVRIQDAIDQAVDGDVIQIWPGTYVGDDGDTARDLPHPVALIQNKSITLQGIEIDGKIVIIDGENERRGIQCEAQNDELHMISIVGLNVTRGLATPFDDIPYEPGETYYPDCGGALLAYRVALNVESCQFNTSNASWGGAAACYRSNVNVTDCMFRNNHSQDFAGALGIGEFSNVLVRQSQFESNTALAGGAISTRASIPLTGNFACNCEWNAGNDNCGIDEPCLYECDLDEDSDCTNCDSDPLTCFEERGGTWVLNSTFIGNQAQVQGGAVCIGGRLETNQMEETRGYLIDCTLKDNTAGEVGGGLWAFGPTHLLLTRCDFITNQADVCIGSGQGLGGGAVGIQGAEYARLTDCLLEDNSTTRDGGGLYAIESHLRVLGTQFVANWAQGNECEGGAVFISDADWTRMDDCLFEGNSASRRGGGISTGSSLADPFLIHNTRFQNNRAQYDIELACSPCHDCWDQDPVYCQCGGGPGNNGWDLAQDVQGGAIYHLGSSMTVEHCCFIGNEAISTLVDDSPTSDVLIGGNAHGGALYREEYQSLIVNACEFAENNAIPYCHPITGVCGEAAGGGIYDSDQIDWDQEALSLQESTFCDNSPSHLDGITVDEDDFDPDLFREECFCTGDANKDGNVDVNDVLMVINAWQQPASDADLDNDGHVDVNDLLIVIENWNQCELELICAAEA